MALVAALAVAPAQAQVVCFTTGPGATGNCYETVGDGLVSWGDRTTSTILVRGAVDLAAARTFNDATGHLVTIGSGEEQAFLAANMWPIPPQGTYDPPISFGPPYPDPNAFLIVNSPPVAAAEEYRGIAAAFPPYGDVLTGDVVLIDDGVGVATNGCEPLTPASEVVVSGNIALIDRGSCPFVTKVLNAQTAGATGVIIANNIDQSPGLFLSMVPPAGFDVSQLEIPAMIMRREESDPVRDLLPWNVTIDFTQFSRHYIGGFCADDDCSDDELTFSWVTGEPVTYTEWCPDSPDGTVFDDSTSQVLHFLDPSFCWGDEINFSLYNTYVVEYECGTTDTDLDDLPDLCDDDDDDDTVPDVDDNCPLTPNPDQANNDGDSQGDACDPDDDNDGVPDGDDNCPFAANPGQENNDGDAQGDACDPDDDNDGVLDVDDNCPFTANPDQANADGDPFGNACDLDDDNDGLKDADDACPTGSNVGPDTDMDGCRDAGEDADDDNDTCLDVDDRNPLVPSVDEDNDGVPEDCDTCPGQTDDQSDADGDRVGDACDNCPDDANPQQSDANDDGTGDACEDGPFFSVHTPQTVANPVLVLNPRQPYGVDHDTGGFFAHGPLMLPYRNNLDALDVDGDTVYFSVKVPGMRRNPDGSVILMYPGIAYQRDTVGNVTVHTNFPQLGMNLQNIDGLDVLDDGSVVFTVSTPQYLFFQGLQILHPANAYRYIPNPPQVVDYFNGGALGLGAIDALDVLRDGSVVFSTLTTVYVYNNGTPTIVPQQDAFRYDPATQTIARYFPEGANQLASLDAFSVGDQPEFPAPELTTTASATPVSCFNGNDGTATATPAGGTPPYLYQWSDGQTTQTATGLAPGPYTVTVTDQTGQTATSTATVGDAPELTLDTSATGVSCNGGTDGTATATASGGEGPYMYVWEDGQMTATATNLAPGPHSVTVKDAHGCAKTATVVVPEPTPVAATSTTTPVSCAGGSDGTATVNTTGGTPPYTYAWNDGQTTQTATGLPAGSYAVMVTDANGCSVTIGVTVDESMPLVLELVSEPPFCPAGGDGTATALVGGGTPPYSYLWNDGQTTQTALVPMGTYSVTVTDAAGCTLDGQIDVSDPEPIVLGLDVTNASCPGFTDGAIDLTPSGGEEGYAFLWSNGATTEDLSGLGAGTYSVLVNDGNACTETDSATVTDLDVTDLVASCLGSAVILVLDNVGNGSITSPDVDNGSSDACGPVTLAASPNAFTCADIGANTVTLTATDEAGNTDTCPAQVDVVDGTPPQAVCKDITLQLCGTDPATITAADIDDGSTDECSLASLTASQTTFTTAGQFPVVLTATDASGNSSTCIATVTVVPSPTVSATVDNDVSCNGASDGQATVITSGGSGTFAYAWSDGQTLHTATGLAGATYSVTVTDQVASCSLTTTVTVAEPPVLTAAAVATDASCSGNTDGSVDLTVSGGTPPYSYAWSNGATTQDLSGLTAGTYTVTVTDANGCTASAAATVSTDPAVAIVPALAVADETTCGSGDGDASVISVLDGNGVDIATDVSFLWSTGATTSGISGLSAGDYSVSVTRTSTGCSTLAQATVSCSPGLAGDFDGDQDLDCDDVNALTAAINNLDLSFDLNGDGVPESADLDLWLALAGAQNASATGGNPYLPGDANLDGCVDGVDFTIWNANKFTSNEAWCSGNFSADGDIDGSDFLIWDANKFTCSND
ncbi:MAG: hypothetical protein GY716_13505 [bacterium]|nr:hypothetical protein [bacterium]